MTVRISATDWVDDGQSLEDALAVAGAFAEAGAAAIDVSTGQVTKRGAAGVRTQLPDAVRRRDPQPARCPHHRGRRDLVVRRRELDPDGRPRRPLRDRPGAPLRPDVDAARRRRAGLRRAGRGVADAVAGRAPQAADRTQRRAEAAPGADPCARPRTRGTAGGDREHPTSRSPARWCGDGSRGRSRRRAPWSSDAPSSRGCRRSSPRRRRPHLWVAGLWRAVRGRGRIGASSWA